MADKMNLFSLRRLYNRGHIGRGTQGVVRRREFKVTLTPATYLALANVVPIGPGLYGSSVTELALRMLVASFGEIDRETVCEELAVAVQDRQAFSAALVQIADRVANYTPPSV